jgi:hypothetical protein
MDESLRKLGIHIGTRNETDDADKYPGIKKQYSKIQIIDKKLARAKDELKRKPESESESENVQAPIIIEEVKEESAVPAPVYISASAIGPDEVPKRSATASAAAPREQPRRSATTRPLSKIEEQTSIFGQMSDERRKAVENDKELWKAIYEEKARRTPVLSAATSSGVLTRAQLARNQAEAGQRQFDQIDSVYKRKVEEVENELQNKLDNEIDVGRKQEYARQARITLDRLEEYRKQAINEFLNPAPEPYVVSRAARPLDELFANYVAPVPEPAVMQEEIHIDPMMAVNEGFQNIHDSLEDERRIMNNMLLSRPGNVSYEDLIGGVNFDLQGEGRGNDDPGLSTDQINHLMKGYPEYLGCIARNEVNTLDIKPESRFGFVMNTDPNTKSGSHWVAIYVDATTNGEHSLEYYNSLADQPTASIIKSIHQVVKKADPFINLTFKVNKIADQSDDSSNCGYFACKFLINRFKGQSFAQASGYKQQYPVGEAKIEKWKKELGIEPFEFFEDGGLHRVQTRKPIVEHRRGRGGRR